MAAWVEVREVRGAPPVDQLDARRYYRQKPRTPLCLQPCMHADCCRQSLLYESKLKKKKRGGGCSLHTLDRLVDRAGQTDRSMDSCWERRHTQEERTSVEKGRGEHDCLLLSD